jgi:hypothetical protein
MELNQTAASERLSLEVSGRTHLPKPSYVAPVLTLMGDIRMVTLGASPGATESSGGIVSRKPSGT